MAQRVVTTCDACDDDGIERPGRATLLRVDDTQAIVDMCDEHRSVFVQPVLELLERFGRPEGRPSVVKGSGARPANAPARPAKPTDATAYPNPPSRSQVSGGYVYPCPLCPELRPFSTGQQLKLHVEREHDVKGSDYGAWLQAKCRACDERPTSPQALARHIQTVHGAVNSATLVANLAATEPQRVAGIVNALVRGTVRVSARKRAAENDSLFPDTGTDADDADTGDH